ncbi:unnamed protein product [Chironomus riparius]|uniref:Uncharacterized protein n=1 Tax=Chironomus riparius TaxID=315576 RepID=A0A9P0IWG0_9DIPT|nr:unnamed protein product [Chironomus riparius]
MDTLAKLRRTAFSPFGANNQEPLIVVEESEHDERDETEESQKSSSPRQSLDIDSPVNPYLLSPWRDPRETRKHSLPTPPCTSGITASQVRRLSERGGEGSGPSPMEQAFLATLSQAPAPQPGGRRHSVVTISKVPSTLFGRCRRESIAAVPNFQRSTPGTSRRESFAGGPPSTDLRGSIHNLQLDIMDDIVQARKARMKLWNTSNEKVCEVQTVDEAGTSSAQRYTNRRFSDFIQSTLAPIPQHQHRRASENPSMLSPSVTRAPSPSPSKKAGIICTNTDLISLLSSLASSATEINRINEVPTPILTQPPSSKNQTSSASSNNFLRPERKSSLKKSNRSNSFDVSILKGVKQQFTDDSKTSSSSNAAGSGWFTKRHMPASKRQNTVKSSAQATVSFARETFDKLTDNSSNNNSPSSRDKTATAAAAAAAKKKKEHKSPLNRLKWDGRSAIVDARIIGSAIEGFLRGGSSSSSNSKNSKDSSRLKKGSTSTPTKTGWFSRTTEDEDSSGDTCDTSSLCATLKDLFVK